MKTILFYSLVGFQLVLSHASFAQNWSFGIQSGINLSRNSVFFLSSNQIKPGLNIGLRADYSSHKRFFFSFMPSYTEKGSRSTLFANDSLGRIILEKRDDKFRLNYIELPIYLGYKLKIAKPVNLYPLAGLYGGYLIKASYENTGKVVIDLADQEIIFHYDNLLKNGLESGFLMHRWEYGYLLGLGLEFKLSNHFGLHVEACRQQALSDFADGLFTVRFFDDNTGLKNKLYAIKMALMYF